MLNFNSSSFETIRHEKIDLNQIDNYMLIIMDGVYCHDCLLKLNNVSESNNMIKKIVVFKTIDNNIIYKKTLIKDIKKYIIADIWLFYQDNTLFSNFNTSVSPNVILKINQEYSEFHYEELFTKNEKLSSFNKFFKLYKGEL